MKRVGLLLGIVVFLSGLAPAASPSAKVLVLHDELPQMKVLAKRLESEGYKVEFVTTKEKLPPLDGYYAVIVFIHKVFPPRQAEAVIRYTQGGGRMIALHHTISSAKRKTPIWLRFLGVTLPQGPLEKGGYKWQHRLDLRLVNLAPGHYITTHNVKYAGRILYKRSDVEETAREREYILFPDSEAFINHKFTDDGQKTVLYGISCRHPALGEKTWMQDRGGWMKKAGKGWIFYFMPGHTVQDLENPAYQQIILNCLTWKP